MSHEETPPAPPPRGPSGSSAVGRMTDDDLRSCLDWHAQDRDTHRMAEELLRLRGLLAELRGIVGPIVELHLKATPEPWEHDGGFRIWARETESGSPYVASLKHTPPHDSQGPCPRRVADNLADDWERGGANADLIAALRNAFPQLLAKVRS